MEKQDITLNIPATNKPRVVVVGGGFGGINLVQNLSDEHFQVVLLSTQNYHGFWPLLYQVATGGLEPDAIAEPLRKLFARKHRDFHFRPVRVTGINPAAQTVSTLLGDVAYDYLVIATGTKANFFGNDQIKQYAFPLKQIPDALNLRSHLLQIFEQAVMTRDEEARQRLLNFVIVGAGPTGVELAGALAEMRRHVLPGDYPGLDASQMNIYLVEGLDRVLGPMSPESSARTHRELEKLGVSIKLKSLVASYDGQVATLNSGEQLPTSTLIWAAGVTGALLEGLPAHTMERGRYLVNEFNQVAGYESIYAIGDIALMRSADYPNGHPGVAQPAIQQGQLLGKNLLQHLQGLPLRPFKYFDKGSLAIIGRYQAVADLPGKKHMGGPLAWLIWLFVHLFYLIGFRSKLVVLANWTYRFFTHQGGTRVVIRPYVRPDDVEMQDLVRRYLED
jgi:NADH dehydrogenase